MKALNKFGNDYATTKFGDVFNRKQTVIGNNSNRCNGCAASIEGRLDVQHNAARAGSNYTQTT